VEISRADEFAEGQRRTKAEFETPTHQLLRASLDRRPDAVSFDYLWSFAYGPVGIADLSRGIRDRPWYVRCEGTTVYYARANDGNTAWEAEAVLFSYSGALITELDLAFEQAGRVVVCAERPTGTAGAPEIWLYWFDVGTGFVFQNFGSGRTPRAILDEPDFTSESDVLVFYLHDGDDEAKMLVQREEYATPHAVPLTDVADKYLEDVVKVSDSRIRIVASVHNVGAGTYTLESVESTLYPIALLENPMQGDLYFLDAAVVKIIIDAGFPAGVDAFFSGPDDSIDGTLLFVAAAIVTNLIVVTQDTDPAWSSDDEWIDAALTFLDAALENAVIVVQHDTDPRFGGDTEETEAALTFLDATAPIVVIVVEQETAARLPGSNEETEGVLSFLSAALVTP
jgi:hypothetical protein